MSKSLTSSTLSNFSITLASLDDANALFTLDSSCFNTPYSKNQFEILSTKDSARVIKANINDKLIGFVVLEFVLDEGFISRICVDKDFRKKGVAHALIEKCTKIASELDLSFISLETRVSNAAAISLYEQTGFIVEGERKSFYTNPTENAYIMTKFIKSK